MCSEGAPRSLNLCHFVSCNEAHSAGLNHLLAWQLSSTMKNHPPPKRQPSLSSLLAFFILISTASFGTAFAASTTSTSSTTSSTTTTTHDSSSSPPTPIPTIQQHLASLTQDGTISPDDFHVHGWRWHSLAFVRDAKRLERLALQLLQLGDDALCQDDGVTLSRAAEHVIDFNLAGLTNVENDVWFPWLRERLLPACQNESSSSSSSSSSTEITDMHRKQLEQILDSVVTERDHINRLAHAVREQARISSTSSIDISKRREAIKNVAEMSASLATRFQAMFEQSAERILVPAVALTVSERDQRAVSNRVIRKLGVLDSRRHLVGMYDAVLDEGSANERELFESEMPSLARAMIPRWRRKLYEPAAGMLDGIHTST